MGRGCQCEAARKRGVGDDDDAFGAGLRWGGYDVSFTGYYGDETAKDCYDFSFYLFYSRAERPFIDMVSPLHRGNKPKKQ